MVVTYTGLPLFVLNVKVWKEHVQQLPRVKSCNDPLAPINI